MALALRLIEDDLSGEAIAALLRFHLAQLGSLTPTESMHAMPIERLRAADVTFWSAWDAEDLAGCGALKELDPAHGEIKSMRAAPEYRGRGVGKAILQHLLTVAKARGYVRLSLETGSADDFLPARMLYASHGFAECGPFGGYREDPFSVFMTKLL